MVSQNISNGTDDIPESIYFEGTTSFLEISTATTTETKSVQYQHVTWEVYYFFGVYTAVVGILGIIGNTTVLLIFTRFRRLRSPANTFVVNLAFCDLCASALHPLTSYSSFMGKWSFGKLGCQIYGAGIGFFGLNSILTLAAIAWERYIVISAQPLNGKTRMTRRRARNVCVFIWIYTTILVLPPFFGWSSYHDEGLGTSCSWDYTTRTWNNRSYYIFLLLLGFVIPLVIITVSYGIMFATVVSSGNEIASMATPCQRGSVRKIRRKSDIKTAQVIMCLIFLFLVAWTPYAIVSLIGQFGSMPLSPIATSIPAHCAKLLVVINPIVYGISHPRFRSSFTQYLWTFSSGSVYPPATPKLNTPVNQTRKRYQCANGNSSPPMSRPSFLSDTAYYYAKSCDHYESKFERRNCVKFGLSQKETDRNEAVNQSEPDLMRCDDRIIRGASRMTFTEYRIKKRSVIQRMFFRSETSLEVVRVANPAEIALILNGVGRRKEELFRQSSYRSSIKRRMTNQQILSPVQDEGESGDTVSNVASDRKCSLSESDCREMRRTTSLKYRSENLATKQMERRNTYRRWSSERRRSRSYYKPKKSSSHLNCCECAQIEFSKCVTLAKVPDGTGGSRVEICLDTPSSISEAAYL